MKGTKEKCFRHAQFGYFDSHKNIYNEIIAIAHAAFQSFVIKKCYVTETVGCAEVTLCFDYAAVMPVENVGPVYQ